MKKFSLILNVILIAAVGYLYYLQYASKGSATITTEDATPSSVIVPKEIKASKIVYINADSLFEKYEYVKEIKKATEGHKAILEKNYNIKTQSFQNDLMAYQERVQQGTISTEQAMATETDLKKRKDEIDGMEDELTRLMDDTQKKNTEMQLDITDFLTEYNKNNSYNYVLAYTSLGGGILYASDSLDITKEIVDGLNKRYEEKKKNKTTTKK